MASISSLMGSSSSSSIYGTRNVISGLATGMDTEALIENAVSGYKLKITSLQQQRTKVGWQQDAYRSIISKMVNFGQKYTSYTSGTNLLSASFFNSAINTKSNGENASKVSASGKTSSDVQVNSVTTLATAARYSTVGNLAPSNVAGGSFNITDNVEVGKLSGSLSLGYGGKTVRVSFDEGDVFESAADMAKAINEKLAEETISFDGGTQDKASNRIKAVADGDTIKFETVKENDGNGVWISSSTTDTMEKALGVSIKDSDDHSVTSFKFTKGNVVEEKKLGEYINEKGITVVVDGKAETIKGFTSDELASDDAFLTALQKKIDDAFGEGKLTVADADNDTSNGITLSFTAKDKNTKFQVTSGADKVMGMEGGLTSYVNTNRKLADLMDGGLKDEWRVEVDVKDTSKLTKVDEANGIYTTSDGTRVKEVDGKYYEVNSADKFLYDVKINGESVATVTEDSTMADLMNAINNSETSDVEMAYSSFTGKFTFTAKDTGKDTKIDFDGLMSDLFETNTVTDPENTKAADFLDYDVKDKAFSINVDGTDYSFTFSGSNGTLKNIVNRLNGDTCTDESGKSLKEAGYKASYDTDTGELVITKLDADEKADMTYNEGVAEDLFTAIKEENGFTAGTDAVFNVTVNGENRTVEQSSNTVEIDGMTLTMKEAFTEGEAVTFTTSADADKIVDVVKQLVDDYNAMATEIKNAYSTLPLQNSSGEYYEPLTDEDRSSMSESAVEAYEEKAKTGLLFGDRELSNLYNSLRDALGVLGVSGNDAQALGITTSYSNGLTTLSLDESALRKALEDDPDKVKDVFTRSKSNGASSDGLMQGLKNVVDRYAGTTGATKGILIQKAGSTLAPTSIYQNTLQTKLDDYDKQIEKWQDKISDQIDYYTSKFTALEQLVAQMNNQSSMLMGLTGGY